MPKNKKKGKKKKRIFYKEKTVNLDTLALNAMLTSGVFGVHAPPEIPISQLKRKGNTFFSS